MRGRCDGLERAGVSHRFAEGFIARGVILVALLFVALAAATAFTKRPWFDEAHFAGPALDLITRGSMGQTVAEPTGFASSPGNPQLRVNTQVYYSVPLSHLAQACWYRLVGFGIFRMRAFHILWGLAALGAWFFIVFKLTLSPGMAMLAALLAGTDRFFVDSAADGRPDMMSAALGALAVAVYLKLRESGLTRAVLVSQTLLAMAVFTHPIGGVAIFALVPIAFRQDRSLLGWRHLALAACPFAVAGALWGYYISLDPAAFRAQMAENTVGRFSSLRAPFTAILNEIRVRFMERAYAPSHATGVRRLTIVIPLIFAAAVIALLVSRSGRTPPGARLLSSLAVTYFFVFAIFDVSKAPFYLVHFTPLLACCTAVWIGMEWRNGGRRRRMGECLCGLLLVLQLGWIGFGIGRNAYHRTYLPATTYLQQHSGPHDLIFAASEFPFQLGFYNNLSDDSTLGYFTGKRAAYIVVDEAGYVEAFKGFAKINPELERYIRKTLTEDYQPVYTGSVYTIYRRKQRVG